MSAPSSTTIRSKRAISERERANSAAWMRRYARSTMGGVYQLPKKTPIFPFGGSALQKRHMGGRPASSSVGGPMA